MIQLVHPMPLACLFLLLTSCTAMTGPEIEVTTGGLLPPCPASPNCVCSDAPAGDSHFISPLDVQGNPQAAWQKLIAFIESDRSYTIVEQRDDYLRAEARTRILRFVDDVSFHLRPDEAVIAMRSASRLGYSDLGKNRRRLETLREVIK